MSDLKERIGGWSNDNLADALANLNSYARVTPPPPPQVPGCIPRMSSTKRVQRFTLKEKKAIVAEACRRLAVAK